jgi:hypothetical protein
MRLAPWDSNPQLADKKFHQGDALTSDNAAETRCDLQRCSWTALAADDCCRTSCGLCADLAAPA